MSDVMYVYFLLKPMRIVDAVLVYFFKNEAKKETLSVTTSKNKGHPKEIYFFPEDCQKQTFKAFPNITFKKIILLLFNYSCIYPLPNITFL